MPNLRGRTRRGAARRRPSEANLASHEEVAQVVARDPVPTENQIVAHVHIHRGHRHRLAAHHGSSRHRSDALLHLRPAGCGAWPPPIGPTGPNVGHDCSYRGHAGAGGTGADPSLSGLHVSRTLGCFKKARQARFEGSLTRVEGRHTRQSRQLGMEGSR